MKILLAVDGSVHTQHMLEYVASQRAWLGSDAELTVLTVVPELPPHGAAYMDAAAVEAYVAAEAAAVLAPIRQVAAAQGWQANFTHKPGHAGAVIAETASEGGFDLVVMGCRGHTPVTSLVLGSVTAQVLARSSVPVLVVPRGR